MLCVGFGSRSPNGGDKARCPSSTASAVCFRSLGVQTSLCRKFKGCLYRHSLAFRCLEERVQLSRQAVQPAVLLLFTSFLRCHVWSLSELRFNLAPQEGQCLTRWGLRRRPPANSHPVIALCRLRREGRGTFTRNVSVTAWSRGVTGWLCFNFCFTHQNASGTKTGSWVNIWI